MSETDRPDGPMRVDTDMVQTLARLLSENDLTEIEVADGERRIAVRRNLVAAAAPVMVPAAAAPPAGAAASAPPPSAASVAENLAAHPGLVASPMVGTAYLSAEPGGKPFVSVGDRVEAGDTILIVEAMKVMNQIPAPHGGIVTRILVQNAEPVEFGQPLVVIE